MRTGISTLLALSLFWGDTAAADEQHERLLQDLLRELVETNTAPSGGGSTEKAARLVADRLLAAGLDPGDISILGPTPELSALVARLRSPAPTEGPILLLAHLDVVEALPEHWSTDPFSMVEKDGWFYGRGTYDNKAGAAILVNSLIRLKQEGFQSNRDFILLLTADEETLAEGLIWLLREHDELIDAELALNTDSGFVLMSAEGAREFRVQTAEKVYATYQLEIRNPGGHSSKPREDNAIYDLSRLLGEVEAYQFPIDLNDTTQAAFRHYLPHASPDERPLVVALSENRLDDPVLQDLQQFPALNALARTTCVTTELNAGHAWNALPRTARATINCRILPQASATSASDLLETLAQPYGADVEVLYAPITSPPSPLEPGLFAVLNDLARDFWPGIDIVPEMEAGATDAAFIRNAGIPTYGISALENDPADDRTHGMDERIGVEALYTAGEFWYRLLQRLGQAYP